MIFREINLPGAYEIELEKRGDERGFFARFFCVREFEDKGLDNKIVQINTSLSAQKGTLRGMHYQLSPQAETKIIRCLRGAIFDVIIDLREQSPTFGQWYGTELNAQNRKMLYAPKGFAHGFITLEDNSEVLYLVTEFYAPELERIIRWNDPRFGIQWPLEPQELSEKDKNQGDFDPSYHLSGK